MLINFVLEDWQIWLYLIIFVVSFLWMLAATLLGAPLIFPRMKALLKRQQLIVLGTRAGKGVIKALPEQVGFLIDKREQYEVRPRTQTKFPLGLDLLFGHQQLGMTMSFEGIAAVNQLDSMGFKSLAEALGTWDDAYLEKNKELIQKEIDKANASVTDQKIRKRNEDFIYDNFRMQGRTLLIDKNWSTPFTLSLSILNDWALTACSSQQNKIITDSAVLDEREKKSGTKDLGRFIMIAGIVMCFLIAASVAVNILPKSCTNQVIHDCPGQNQQPSETTTTTLPTAQVLNNPYVISLGGGT